MITLKKGKNDPAVSPVVGVLLMLVVTIIIAAIVSGFAGGITDSKQKTPQASFDATFGLTDCMGGPALTIRHLSGDPVNTKNVQLITSWANATGEVNVAKSTQPKYSAEKKVFYPAEGYTCNFEIDSLNCHSSYGYYWHEPYLVINGLYPSQEEGPSVWWGNYTIKAGDAIQVAGNIGGSAVEGKELIKNYKYLKEDDTINVKLIDTPTGGTLFEKNVIVKG